MYNTSRLTSIDDNITSSHPRGVALRAHQHGQITNLLRLGESVCPSALFLPLKQVKDLPVEGGHILPFTCVGLGSLVGVRGGHLGSDVSVCQYLRSQSARFTTVTNPGEIQLTEIP
jgi:hypothetical protein